VRTAQQAAGREPAEHGRARRRYLCRSAILHAAARALLAATKRAVIRASYSPASRGKDSLRHVRDTLAAGAEVGPR
jgi:hypothetical protein